MSATHSTNWNWPAWRGDEAVRRLTPDERGIWIDLLSLAAAGNPTGFVVDAQGRQIPLEEIGRFTNCSDLERLSKLINAIVEKGAGSRDRTGRLFNRRMVRDSSLSAKRQKVGKDGAEAKWGPREPGTRSERLQAARRKGAHTKVEWLAMLHVFGGCVKCGVRNEDLIGGHCSKDHIVPIFRGGSDSIENIQPMCRNCNSGKVKDDSDYRSLRVTDWRERMAKCLAGAGPPSEPASSFLSSSSSDPSSGLDFEKRWGVGTARARDDGWPRDAFEQFYKLYPNKVGRPKAEEALAKVRRGGAADFTDIMAGLLRYVAKTDDRAWCNPATWLNQHRWADQPATVNGGPNGQHRQGGGNGARAGKARGLSGQAYELALEAADEHGQGSGSG